MMETALANVTCAASSRKGLAPALSEEEEQGLERAELWEASEE